MRNMQVFFDSNSRIAPVHYADNDIFMHCTGGLIAVDQKAWPKFRAVFEAHNVFPTFEAQP